MTVIEVAIVDHATNSEIVQEIDPDFERNLYDLYGEFVVRRPVYNESFHDFLHARSFNISMSANQIGGEFTTSKLIRLLESRFRRGRHTVHFRRGLCYSFTLHLHAEKLTLAESADEMRFDMLPFLIATFGCPGGMIVNILIHHGDGTTSSFTTTTDKLRR